MKKGNFKNPISELKKNLEILKKKFVSFYSAEGSDLDKDIFINSEQRLLKVASSIIVLSSFLGIGWLAIAKTDEIIIVPGKIIPIGKVKEIKMPMSGVIEEIQIKEGDLVDKNQVLMKIESDSNSNLTTTLENSIKIKRQQIDSLNSQILMTQEIYSKIKNYLKIKLIFIKILVKGFKLYLMRVQFLSWIFLTRRQNCNL